MGVTKQDIEKPRSPSGLKKYCDEQRSLASSDDDERKKSHRRRGDGAIYQPYFTEIEPLSRFCKEFYRDCVLIRPVLGNQQYDAEVAKWGKVLEKIEITKPHDGKALSDDLILLADRGFGGHGGKTPLRTLKDLEPLLEKTAKKKSEKNYQGAVLVFAITYDPPFPPLNEESEIQFVLMKYVNVLSKYKYNARKVLMFDIPSNRIYSVQRGTFLFWLLGLLVRH